MSVWLTTYTSTITADPNMHGLLIYRFSYSLNKTSSLWIEKSKHISAESWLDIQIREGGMRRQFQPCPRLSFYYRCKKRKKLEINTITTVPSRQNNGRQDLKKLQKYILPRKIGYRIHIFKKIVKG